MSLHILERSHVTKKLLINSFSEWCCQQSDGGHLMDEEDQNLDMGNVK